MTALLEVLIRGSLVLLVGLLLMPLLRRHSAALRHWVLAASLLCAAVMPLASAVLPTWDALAVGALVPPPVVQSVLPAVVTRNRPSATPPSPFDVARTSVSERSALERLVIPVWAGGTAVSLAILLVGIWRLRRLHTSATPVTTGLWRTAVVHDVDVRVTSRPGLVLVWGVRRPTIIVPTAALSWSHERIRAVLHHEFAHIQRNDWPLQIASEIVRAIYWFNPLVWITCARLRAECEIACDDIAIAHGAAGTEYATHVVEIARELNTRSWLPAPAIVRASTLERRVRAMLDKTSDRRPLTDRARAGALAAFLMVTVLVAGLAAQSFVSLSGTIVDSSNGVLPGVKLVLTNEQTQAKYEIQTDRTGRYEFVGLPPGNYIVDAALPGFSRFTGRISVGTQNLQQDVTMPVGMIQETITVRQDAPTPTPDPERDRRIEELKKKRAASRCPGAVAADDVRVGGNIRVPVKYRDFRPHYPESLRGTEGVVVLKTTIGTSGSVEDIEVVSSTHAEFTQAAIEAVKQWEFDATLLNCEPIVTPMQVTVNFATK